MFTLPTAFLTQKKFLIELQNALDEFEEVTDKHDNTYYNIPAAFDIEVSSFYEKLEGKEYENQKGDKRAVMYVWQFGIYSFATYGRTWEEYRVFIGLVNQILGLNENHRLMVFVHNLPYEFQFIRKRYEWSRIFLLEERSPVYALSDGIEYRCSLKLSGGKSLANVAKDLVEYKTQKMSGDLDYLVIRTPKTPLTTKEMGYILGDIVVLLAYIQEKIEHDGSIIKIPLTNTGYVRAYCRKSCFRRYKRYRRLMDILQLTPEEYEQAKATFLGGFTHANAHYVQQVLTNVQSYDFASSYPAVMVLEKFPMSAPKLITHEMTEEEFEGYLLSHCCMFELELWDVIPKRNQDHPLSHSKCTASEGVVEDNGRVVVANYIKTNVTEQDFFVYREFYHASKIRVSNFRVFEKQYLPTPFVRAILDLYRDKTKLKGIKEELVNYMVSKNMINAAYGMIVTAIVRDSYKYINNEYVLEGVDINKEIKKYNENVRRFLYYPWGVWVTAYARANLFSGIIACGDDYVYSDTDSIKLINPEKHRKYFEDYNRAVLKKIELAAKYHGISVDDFMPPNKHGVKQPIGVWDDDGFYIKFKTLGAKRYFTLQPERYQVSSRVCLTRPIKYKHLKIRRAGKYKITLAGANKGMTRKHLVRTPYPFDEFDDNLVLPKDVSGRTTATYIDHATHGVVYDYLGIPYEYDELSSIHMEPTEYHLSIYANFKEYLYGIRNIEGY